MKEDVKIDLPGIDKLCDLIIATEVRNQQKMFVYFIILQRHFSYLVKNIFWLEDLAKELIEEKNFKERFCFLIKFLIK